MNILITGYNGFIGSNLVHCLSGHRLIGVDLYKGNTVDEHIDWAEVQNITNIDCVIHLAAKGPDTKKNSTFKEYYDVNVGLTKKIFQVFLYSKAKKFIYFSSVAAATENVPLGEILTEDFLPNPQTNYGKSKLDRKSVV